MTQPTASLPIFRAGTHTSVDGRKLTFTSAILRELAEGYDPQVSEAPLVVGHPRLDAPAYGWAKSLKAEGELLYAEPHQVEPQFAELVNAGRFKKISASIYLPDSPGNPTPGKHYVRHIGFLGAAAPAVKGLPSVQFADGGDGGVEFAQPLSYLGSMLADLFQRLRDWFVERDGVEAADKIIPQWSIRSLLEEPPAPPTAQAFADPAFTQEVQVPDTSEALAVAFAEREQSLSTREADLAARDQVLAAREAQARRDDAAAFAETLVRDGKLLPREQEAVVELLLALPVDASVSFAEGDGQVTRPAAEVLRQLLTDRPKQIDFAEKSGASSAPAAVSFAAPDGMPVDAVRADLHARAIAYQAEHAGTPYVDAVRAVSG